MLFSCAKKKEERIEKETIIIGMNLEDKIEIEKRGINEEIIETKKALEKDKENAMLYLKLAEANLKKQYTYSAIESAREAVKYKPNLAEGYKIMADAYFNRENYKRQKRII